MRGPVLHKDMDRHQVMLEKAENMNETLHGQGGSNCDKGKFGHRTGSPHDSMSASQNSSLSGFVASRPMVNWIQQYYQTLPRGYNSSGSVDFRDSMARHFPFVTLNAGSLVLDSARSELVNAAKMTPKEILEAKALAASKNHSEAERRRRERINTHLATLRNILPSSIKTDKASLLAEVISQVRHLKRQVSEIYDCGSMPTDHDELKIEKDPASAGGRVLFRAVLCCDDRPSLISDLKKTLDSLGLRTLKAEISTLGGRIKNIFVVTSRDIKEQDEGMSMKRMQESLRLVMEKPRDGEVSPRNSSKRQRLATI